MNFKRKATEILILVPYVPDKDTRILLNDSIWVHPRGGFTQSRFKNQGNKWPKKKDFLNNTRRQLPLRPKPYTGLRQKLQKPRTGHFLLCPVQ